MSTASDSPYTTYEIRHRVPNPATAALLVIDVQNYFSTIATPILPALHSTIHLCRAANIPVIYTRHRHRSPSDHGMLAEWWDHHLVLDATPDSLLHPDISRLDGDMVVEKSTYSAFLGTGLEETLRGMGVEEVIVTGVMTNLCCLSMQLLQPFQLVLGFEGKGNVGLIFTKGDLKEVSEKVAEYKLCDGSIVAFAVLHNVNCNHGFIYVTSQGLLKICQLPSVCNYDSYWPVQKIPLRGTPHQVTYFAEKNCTWLDTVH